MKNAAIQNGKVWARRLGVEFDPQAFEAALSASGFTGSVLKGPLTLVFFKKISAMEWGKTLGRDDRRVVSRLMGSALASVLRGEDDSILAALAVAVDSNEEESLFGTHCLDMCSVIGGAIAARTEEKTNTNLVDAVLKKQRGVGGRLHISDDPEAYGI